MSSIYYIYSNIHLFKFLFFKDKINVSNNKKKETINEPLSGFHVSVIHVVNMKIFGHINLKLSVHYDVKFEEGCQIRCFHIHFVQNSLESRICDSI